MRSTILAATLGLALSGPAFADAGVRPIWEDFQPATSTQYRPPDGGRRYLPPDTSKLIMGTERLDGTAPSNDPNRQPDRRYRRAGSGGVGSTVAPSRTVPSVSAPPAQTFTPISPTGPITTPSPAPSPTTPAPNPSAPLPGR